MITPNEDQSKALKLFNDWDWNKHKVFRLSGIAGSGKSKITQLMLGDKKGNVPKRSVRGVATSNMACLNLQKSIPTCSTLAKTTGLALDFDDDSDIPMATGFVEKKDFRRDSELDHVRKLAVDEISMLGMSQINKCISVMPNLAKTIILGDEYQLSLIGAVDDNDSELFKLPGYTLTQPVRQSDTDEIFKLATNTREMISNNESLSNIFKRVPNKAFHDGKGYSQTSLKKGLESLASSIKSGEDSLAATFRRSTSKNINDSVRKIIHGDIKQKYVAGDIVMASNQYNPNTFWQRLKNGNLLLLSKGKDLMLNGERFTVLDSKEVLLKKSYLLSMYKSNDYLNNNWGDINKLKNIYHDVIGSGIWAWQLVLDGVSQPINVLHDDGIGQYMEAKKQLMELAYIHGNIGIALQFINKFADITYGYSATLYRLQGSTIKKCYVSMTDIFGCTKLSNKRRLQSFYTAATRPTHNLAIF